jgi:dolichol-phosphate mannosyltransferase
MTTQAPAERVHLELRGDGVVLRTVSPEDREAVWEAEVASLEELKPWFWWCHPEHTRERSAGWVASRDDAWRKGQEYSLLVRATDSDRVLGCVFLNAIDKISLRGSLGYWIRPDAGRKGVATEAAALIVKWAFEALALERIEIVAAVANERSQKLAERLGARREGVARKRLRVGGVSTDAVIYALLRDDRPGEPPAAAKRPGTASDALALSVVVPVRNEEKNIPELSRRVDAAVRGMGLAYELVFVTDINTDRTVDVLRETHAKNPNVKAVKLADGRGQHVAVVAGLDASRGRAVVVMDGDLQDCPEDIPKLYERLQAGFDVVYGVKEKKNDSALRNFFSRRFVAVMNALSDQRLDHNTSMFRVMSRRTVDQLKRFRESEPSVTGLVTLINFPTDRVLVTSGTRQAGETNYSFMRQVNLAISFLLSFSTKPLRMISVLGLVVAGASFIYLLIILLQAIFIGVPVAGWATLVSLVTFLSGVQMLAIGLIGVYVGRIFVESKRRPLYIVEERIGDLAEVADR